MQGIEKLLGDVSDVVWGAPLLVLLFGTHLYLTFRLRFLQRYIGRAIRLSFERGAEGEGDVSHFGALTTALAATIGTGNIVGVATAVAAGGPGAVLWMWLTGIFGIATSATGCEKPVPFMAVFYVVGCTILLVMHAGAIPETLRLILRGAWSGQAAVGGFAGAGMREAVRYGIARGLFSNESGLGSAP